MEAKTIAKILEETKAGQFFSVTIRRPAKTFKGTIEKIEKMSQSQGILCDYANRKPVKEGVENDERTAPELPKHIKESAKIGPVKFWYGNNDETYLPVCATGNEPKVKWFMDGIETDYKTVEPMLLASERLSKPTKSEVEEKSQAQFFGVNVKNVIAVNGQSTVKAKFTQGLATDNTKTAAN